MSFRPVPAAAGPAPAGRQLLFTPGPRLGWVFRDRRETALAYPEPQPDPRVIQAQAAARTAGAEQAWTRAWRWAGKPSIALAVILVLGAGCQKSVDGSFSPGLTLITVVVLCGPGLGYAGWCWLRRDQARALPPEREYHQALAEWEERAAGHENAELARLAGQPEWGSVPLPGYRTDIFGGTLAGWQALLTVHGASILAQRPLLTVDLTGQHAAGMLSAAARDAGVSSATYRLPQELVSCGLLTELTPAQLADAVAEALHAQAPDGALADRSVDVWILQQLTGALGGNASPQRLAAAVRAALGHIAAASVVHLPGGFFRRLPRVVGSSDVLGSHGESCHRRGSAGVERIAKQLGHGVLGVVFECPVEGDVGERAIAVLPGGEGKQRCGRGGVAGAGQGGQVGPQSRVSLAVAGVHTGPGVVPDLHVFQGQSQPGSVLVRLELAAVPVQADRVGHRLQSLLQQRAPTANRAAGPARRPNEPRGAFLCGAGGLAHGVGGVSGDRGDGRGQGLAGSQDLARVLAGDGVRLRVERGAVRRAASRVGADVGPVAAVLDPQQFPHGDADFGEPGTQRAGCRGDQVTGAVPDRVGLRDFLRAEDAGGVRCERAHVLLGGDVVAECDPDGGARRSGAEYHDAVLGWLEPEQDRDGGQQAGR